ncbi:beta-ketoacyl-[acyl-carrier-protein] synthase family protein [Candidatus Binatia bacterium]|nr:beta-ketoacyl-[acyl-carrier-protein] synthase family protein [Candidatus Binatia bacterium]
MDRAVITGIGLVGPTGFDVRGFWDSILRGPACVRRITRFDPTGYASQIAAEVPDRSYEELIDPRKVRTTTHVTRMALAAAEFALRDARLSTHWEDPTRVGVIVGTSLGGWFEAEQQHSILLERGARRVNPFIANGTPNHAAGAEVAGALGAQGPQATFSSGCVSSLQAIGHAAMLVRTGEVDVCVAGGFENPIAPLIMAGMGRTQELSARNDDPQQASRPFDAEHAGIVLSEGSCFVLIESPERAAARGIDPYADVLGAASSCDGAGLFGVDQSGKAGASAIRRLLERAGLQLDEVDYICSHANSSPLFDRKETTVVKAAFGDHAGRLAISSIKGVIGHPFGASGAFQTAASALAIRHQTIPPTHNLRTPDAACDLDYVPGEPRRCAVRKALVTSYGYGGLNSYLLLGALNGAAPAAA